MTVAELAELAEPPAESRTARRRKAAAVAILEAARSLVLERGADAMTLRELARRSDYSPAALYTYFDGREAILAALGMGAVDVLTGYLASVPVSLAPQERVMALGLAYCAFADDHPEDFALAFSRLSSPTADWEHYTKVARPFTIVIDAMRDGVAAGVFHERPELDAEAMAFTVWACVHGSCALRSAHLRDVTAPYAGLRRAMLDTCLRGLTAACEEDR